VRDFARETDVSISEAVRQLLQESPRLVECAKKKGIDLEVSMKVSAWGGQRRDSDEGEE
jgi:hypothetical protein